jgi:hypothetical protein
MPTNTPLPANAQAAEETIAHHWQAFPQKAKTFILQTLDEMSLERLIQFWGCSSMKEFTRGTVCWSMYRTSWYLALVYVSIGKYEEARALTLHGAFLQECYVS